MVKSITLLVAAAAVSSVDANTNLLASGSDAAMVWAVNTTFCDSLYKQVACDKTLETKSCVSGSADLVANKCWDIPQNRDESKDAEANTRLPYTKLSHLPNSVGSNQVTASGSCFQWNAMSAGAYSRPKAPMSARAWCGGSSDAPTVQFYKSGNCAEETELGGSNNKDDKGLLFATSTTCGTFDAEKDGPFATLGAFSCVQVADTFNVVSACPAATEASQKLPGRLTKVVPNIYTLATDTCAASGGGGDSIMLSGFTHQGGKVLSGNAMCYDDCSRLKLTPYDEPVKCATAAEQATDDCKLKDPENQLSCSQTLDTDKKVVDGACALNLKPQGSKQSTEQNECYTKAAASDGYKAIKDDCDTAQTAEQTAFMMKECPTILPYYNGERCKLSVTNQKCCALDDKECSPTGYAVEIKTTEAICKVEADCPSRPIDPMYFVYAGVALLVIIIIVCVVCKPCSSKASPSGEAATEAKPAASNPAA